MEIHTHAHTHPATDGTRKKWAHYFWEFLMLFLAVFCGFLAEYQLEHVIEHQREKKYALALYEDLKADTSILNASSKERNFIIPKIDTFRFLVHSKAIDEIPAGTWAYFGRFPTRNIAISLQDATLQQLLSSGGSRLFKNHDVANGIAKYDQALRNMKEAFTFISLAYSDLINARNKIFDAWYLDEIMDLRVSNEKVDSFKKKSFPLLSTNKADFIQYANLCQLRSFDLKNLVIRIDTAAKKAERLLLLLKQEYLLE